jgi:hypothetical protein
MLGSEGSTLFDHADEDGSFGCQPTGRQLVGPEALVERRLGQCHAVFDQRLEHRSHSIEHMYCVSA